MTDPQPMMDTSADNGVSNKDTADKMDIDASPAVVLSSSSPPSSEMKEAVKDVHEKDGSSSTALKCPDDKQASSYQPHGGGGSSSPKPKIKISLKASSNSGDKKSNGKSSSSTSSVKKTTTKPSLTKSSSSGSYSGVGGGGGMQRSKAYQGNLRSAAAAHRKDKVAIPPIGSPGLLMMPNPALTANFPKDIETPEELKKWLYNGHFLLPATVFRRAMEVGGYTVQQRLGHPHRGSSTERQVGDMFDSDVGGLYLHFPELIPRRVWDRRLGGEMEDYNDDDDDMDDFPVRDRRKRRRRSSSKRRQSSDTKAGGSKSKDHHSGVKGARSSYIFFTHEMRPKMMAEFPGMKFTEQGIIMGERWRALTPEQKKPYEDLANEDKKRYATEWAAYLETVKKEIRDEKEMGGKKKEEDDDTNNDDGDDEEEEEEEEDKPMVKPTTVKKKGNEAAIKGPRLVDAVILSLCNILGEKAYRREPLPPMPQKNQESLPTSASNTLESKPLASVSLDAPPSNANITATADVPKSDSKPTLVVPEQSKSDSNIVKPANPEPITSSESNNVATTDDSKEATSQTPKDLALEELPKLNPTVPQTRKRCRPHEPMSFLDMIPTSLTCTYPQEYVAKRRAYAEAVRVREEAIIASQEAKDDADDAQEKYLAHTEAWERMLEYQKQQITKRAAERQRQKEKKESENKTDKDDNGDVETGNEISKEEEKEEDPMDCMPPQPKSPPPALIVSVPDIPTPPSPPQLFEIDGDDMGTDNNNTTSMFILKKKMELLQHLDPECFVPNMDGRYFGLISNSIADPQFVGPTSTGIRGTTFGGGTGLATSYVGGGRGASGLVSGPSRSTIGSRTSSTLLAMDEDAKTTASALEGTPAKPAKKEKKMSSATTPPPSSSPKIKKKKKESKKLCLATGDRITSASEVSSGPAGPDFPEGWVIKTYRRSGGETIGKTDRFWFSPGRNIRFRAKKHSKQFIDILKEPSINGDEDAAAEAYKKRGLHF